MYMIYILSLLEFSLILGAFPLCEDYHKGIEQGIANFWCDTAYFQKMYCAIQKNEKIHITQQKKIPARSRYFSLIVKQISLSKSKSKHGNA